MSENKKTDKLKFFCENCLEKNKPSEEDFEKMDRSLEKYDVVSDYNFYIFLLTAGALIVFFVAALFLI